MKRSIGGFVGNEDPKLYFTFKGPNFTPMPLGERIVRKAEIVGILHLIYVFPKIKHF